MSNNNFAIANEASLYIHIPFCQTKCFYCDFNTYAKLESLIPSYINALESEAIFWSNYFNKTEIKSIFIGGGTPSYIPSKYIEKLMETIFYKFKLTKDSEITLESNPNDLTKSNLKTYYKSGINRISLGVQTFDNSLLKVLGRRHSSQNAIEAYYLIKESGFKNINLDLMYGLPNQSTDKWVDTLYQLLSLKPLHVSMYALTLEEGTPMNEWIKEGKLPKQNDDIVADMYSKTEEIMSKNNYLHYEISNWAISGFESKHNINYWKNKTYIGIGPGAHSYIPPYRFSNIKSPREYTKHLNNLNLDEFNFRLINNEKLKFIDTSEIINTELEMSETIMLGLRLNSGIDIEQFKIRFDINPLDKYSNNFDELNNHNLIEITEDNIKLTPKGRLLSNEVFLKFF